MSNWFSIGQPPQRATTQDSVFKRVGRFYVKVKEPKKIIFLDDVSKLNQIFVCYEHNPVIQGQFYHYFTCSNSINCYLCTKGSKAYQTYFLTILENDRQDNTKWYKVLFPIKKTAQGNLPAWEKLEKKLTINKMVSLKYAQFLVDRYDLKEAAVGSEFDYLGTGEADIKNLNNPDLSKPFDYITALQPKPDKFFTDLEKQGIKIEYVQKKREEQKPNTIPIQY